MNTTDSIHDNQTTPATDSLENAVRKWLAANGHLLRQWRSRAAGRRRLLSMEDFRLDDIGIDRGAALDEAAKPFWKQ